LSLKAWKEKNKDGYFYICRYNMEASFPNDQDLIKLTSSKRVPGQPPLRRRSTVGRYMPLPGSEAVRPPAPPPVTGRQRIMQQVQAALENDASFLGISL
jgi:hypothetical protein